MHWNVVDALQALLACAVYIAITLAWVHLSRQNKVSRSYGSSIAITVKLIFIHSVAFVAVCMWLGLPVIFLLGLLGIAMLLSPLASMDDRSVMNIGDNALALAVGFVVLFPIFVLKQYVLGFPERDHVMLRPPVNPTAVNSNRLTSDEDARNQVFATVVATLRPMGTVECNRERLNATSVDGTLIEVGDIVRICGRQNGQLLVCRSNEPNETFGADSSGTA